MKHKAWWLVGLVVVILILWELWVKFKDGVSTEGVKWQTFFALGVAAFIRRTLGGGPLTVTSTTDGDHPAGAASGRTDLHYLGLAADIRTNDWLPQLVMEWYDRLKKFLFPLGYDVVLESNHIHIEYDPKEDRSMG